MPIHTPEYVCCKLILRPNKFHSRESFFDFGKVFKEPAKENGVKFTTEGFIEQPVKIREVLFIDTDEFRLYNNAFILRRRIPYKDGFPIGEPEIVFKYRSGDLQTAAETDVRPNILGDHRVKFKVQALPLKEKLGGIRLLYSHNVQFNRGAIGMGRENISDMDALIDILPALAKVSKHAERTDPSRQQHHRRGGPPGHRLARLRRRPDLQGQRRHLAYPRRASPAYRRVRLPVPFQRPHSAQP